MPSRSKALTKDFKAADSVSHAGPNPILLRTFRGAEVETWHRGCWALVDSAGTVLESAGAVHEPIYARSTVKSMQAMPLVESGAADRFEFEAADLALALASHDGEAIHTERVARILARLDCGFEDLQCGAHPPTSRERRDELKSLGQTPTALHNNCSGKHAGFLALAKHLGQPLASYLDSEGEVQRLVRQALGEISGIDLNQLGTAVDGCSAPTFRLPLVSLATAFARVSDPTGEDQGAPTFSTQRRTACERMLAAAAEFPELIAGTRRRLCTDLLRASGGRLFPKIGGSSVYAVGLRDAGRALVVKIDDGAGRALASVVVRLLARFGWLSQAELEQLNEWTDEVLCNWAQREVGRSEVDL